MGRKTTPLAIDKYTDLGIKIGAVVAVSRQQIEDGNIGDLARALLDCIFEFKVPVAEAYKFHILHGIKIGLVGEEALEDARKQRVEKFLHGLHESAKS